MPLPYKHELITHAKRMRKAATPQENHLWYDFLRSYPIRFQRQKAIEHYIADFYCFKAKLIIEIDGSQHYERQEMERDQVRTMTLEKYGLTVLRFSNREINTEFRAVCERIDDEVRKRLGVSEEDSLSQLR